MIDVRYASIMIDEENGHHTTTKRLPVKCDGKCYADVGRACMREKKIIKIYIYACVRAGQGKKSQLA